MFKRKIKKEIELKIKKEIELKAKIKMLSESSFRVYSSVYNEKLTLEYKKDKSRNYVWKLIKFLIKQIDDYYNIISYKATIDKYKNSIKKGDYSINSISDKEYNKKKSDEILLELRKEKSPSQFSIKQFFKLFNKSNIKNIIEKSKKENSKSNNLKYYTKNIILKGHMNSISILIFLNIIWVALRFDFMRNFLVNIEPEIFNYLIKVSPDKLGLLGVNIIGLGLLYCPLIIMIKINTFIEFSAVTKITINDKNYNFFSDGVTELYKLEELELKLLKNKLIGYLEIETSKLINSSILIPLLISSVITLIGAFGLTLYSHISMIETTIYSGLSKNIFLSIMYICIVILTIMTVFIYKLYISNKKIVLSKRVLQDLIYILGE